MFANVVRRDTGHTSLYECDTIRFNQLLKDNKKIIVDLESKNGCKSIDLNKETCELYVMNNEGQTIHTYRWSFDD